MTAAPESPESAAEEVRPCEHYWAWVHPAGAKTSARICMTCHAPDAEWLNSLIEFDTPAEAANAAAILAATPTAARIEAEVIERLAVEAESWPDDEADAGGAVADWLRSRIPQNTSPAGLPTPTMDQSERANGGSSVASRTGTGPAGEAEHYPAPARIAQLEADLAAARSALGAVEAGVAGAVKRFELHREESIGAATIRLHGDLLHWLNRAALATAPQPAP